MSSEETLQRITIGDRSITIVGTAHVSPTSVAQVKQVIEQEQPDSVCIELDLGRFKSMKDSKRWKNTNIAKVIKDGKSGFLFANIILSNYQRKIAEQFNIQSGQEMFQAISSAEECGAELVMADRDIQITFSRIWHGCSFFEKLKLIGTIIMSVISNEEITEDELEALKQEDMLSVALSEMGDSFSGLKHYLVDERDEFLSNQIKNAPGKNIVAVVGAAHVPGILQNIYKNIDVEEISKIPPKSKVGKVLGWMLPAIFVILVVATFYFNPSSGVDQMRNWLIMTMVGAGIGASCSLGHPLTIITAVVMAPISALSPVLAAGWFSGLMEAYLRKPKVEDFEKLSIDLYSVSGLWHNTVTRILLIVILTNFGCALGNILGSFHIIQVFFNTVLGF